MARLGSQSHAASTSALPPPADIQMAMLAFPLISSALTPATDVPGGVLERPVLVESGCGAVAVGSAYLFPPLSSGGVSTAEPWLRFHTPLIEPDVRY